MAYITRVQIERCRNVRQLEIDLSVPADENGANGSGARPRFRHLILTGPNGSGKSGILQEVAGLVERLLYPLVRDGALSTPLVQPADDDPATTTNLERNAITWNARVRAVLAAGDHGELRYVGGATASRGEILAVYVPARRGIQPQKVAGPSKLDWEPGNLATSTEAATKLLQFLVNKRMEQALAAEDRDTAAVERIRGWFSDLEGYVRRLTEDDGLALDFDRHAFNFRFRRSDGYTFDINTLADGHAAALSVLAELLIRVDVIREARKDHAFMPEGVVVIDELEAHLHLELQEQILPFLTGLFPSFQFIVATHSPAVIASIPNAVVYDLRTREPVLSDHLRGIRYGMLMTEHFGISSEVDLDTTEMLDELREIAGRSTRTPDDERRSAALSAELLARSPAMASEIWAIRERLGERGVAGEAKR